MQNSDDKLKKVIAHSKEYGFVFPSSEIYDGLSAAYDYGQYGSELKNNIKNYWWTAMTRMHQNIVGIDASIFMHPTTWKASGHVDAFNDPLIDNKDSKKDTVPMFFLKIISRKLNKKSTRKLKRHQRNLVMLSTKNNFEQRIQTCFAIKKKSTP